MASLCFSGPSLVSSYLHQYQLVVELPGRRLWLQFAGASFPTTVTPVTRLAHFLWMVSYSDSHSSSLLCLPVSMWERERCDLKVSTQLLSWQKYMSALVLYVSPTTPFPFVSSPNGSITFRLVSSWADIWRSQYCNSQPGPMSYPRQNWIPPSSMNWKLFSKPIPGILSLTTSF